MKEEGDGDLFSPNDPHHGAAGLDVVFRIRWPPPLPCMRWFGISSVCGVKLR